MKKLLLSLFVLFTLAMPTVAYVQDAVSASETELVEESSPSDLFVTLLTKIQEGEWVPAFGAVLMLAVFGARKLLSIKYKFFGNKLGGYLLSFGIGLGSVAGLALLASQPITFSLMATAFGASYAAAGGWESLKDVIEYLNRDKAEA